MKRRTNFLIGLVVLLFAGSAQSQTAPPAADLRLYDISRAPSAQRLQQDVAQLASYGTRNTLSDTVSETRGIGAARRWIKAEFERISEACGGCLEIYEQRTLVPGGRVRIPRDVYVVNIYAIQRGTAHPDRYVIMSGDIDSRGTDAIDAVLDAPGANDNATGMAGAIEAARVLTQYRFGKSIVYAGLSGEEQALFGGQHLALLAADNGWKIEAVLNNDMIGNVEGITGILDNRSFRIFSEPVPPTETERERASRRFYGGEVDGISRQLARYVHRLTSQYLPELQPRMVYRLDRFGRGGHHRPFNDQGFPAIRIMESHEHYDRQHQDLRTEDGRFYGDVIDYVNFPYAAKLTGVNVLTMAALADAPPPPSRVLIGGVVSADTRLQWEAVQDPDLAGYYVYWRDTTEPQWTHKRFVGNVTEFTLENWIIDDYFYGVSSVNTRGNESVVVFPNEVMRR